MPCHGPDSKRIGWGAGESPITSGMPYGVQDAMAALLQPLVPVEAELVRRLALDSEAFDLQHAPP